MDTTLRILALLAAAAAPAAAQTLEEVRWSRGDGLWTDAEGWSPEVVPDDTPDARYHAVVPTLRTVRISASEQIEITRLSGAGTVMAEGRSFAVAEWEASGRLIVNGGDFSVGVVRPHSGAFLSVQDTGRGSRIDRIEPDGAALSVVIGPGGRLHIAESDGARLVVRGDGGSLDLDSDVAVDSFIGGTFAFLGLFGSNHGTIQVHVESLFATDFINRGSALLWLDGSGSPVAGRFSRIENTGALRFTTDHTAASVTSTIGLVNSGVLEITGGVSVSAYDAGALVANTGIIELSAGVQLLGSAEAGLAARSIVNEGSIRVGLGGAVWSPGTIVNGGRIEISIGLPAGHPGPRGGSVFAEVFEQTSEGELRIALAGNDTVARDAQEFLGVHLNGPASLAGTLSVDILPPFSPAPGDEFFILKTRSGTPLADLIAGAFDRIQLPPLHGAAWNADALYTEGVLRVVEACGAEWDGQPGVDVGDLLAFLADFRDGAPGADVTGDGRTDVADLLTFLGSFRAGC